MWGCAVLLRRMQGGVIGQVLYTSLFHAGQARGEALDYSSGSNQAKHSRASFIPSFDPCIVFGILQEGNKGIHASFCAICSELMEVYNIDFERWLQYVPFRV